MYVDHNCGTHPLNVKDRTVELEALKIIKLKAGFELTSNFIILEKNKTKQNLQLVKHVPAVILFDWFSKGNTPKSYTHTHTECWGGGGGC